MSSDFETSAAAPPSPVVPRQFQSRKQTGYFRDQTHSAQGEQAGTGEPPADISLLLGMPPDQVPEPVRQVMGVLMAEIDRLRDALAQAQRQIAWLEERGDRHPDAPVSSRKAFLRDLTHAIERMDIPDSEEVGRVVALRLDGYEVLIETEGEFCGAAAKEHVAAALRANLRQSDPICYQDGGIFLMCLVGSTGEAADEKVRRLAEAVTGSAFEWEGTPIMLQAATGQAVLLAGDAVESICAKAVGTALTARGPAQITR